MSPIAKNRKAAFDYEVLEKFSAGIQLTGTETKSVRAGHVNLAGAHVSVRGGEAFLLNADIPAHQPKNAPDHDNVRARKLLLGKQEITELEKAENTKGLTIVPLSVYNKGRFFKVDVAIARGKKSHDKREAIKKRDTERDLNRKI